MRKAITLFILSVLALKLSAQTTDSTITIKNPLFSTQYIFQGQPLTLQGASKVVKINPEAYAYLKEARGYKVFGNWFKIAGFLGLGYIAASLVIPNQEINPMIALAGVGCLTLSVPFNLAASREAKTGIGIYNSSLRQAQPTSAFNFSLGGTGVKLMLSF